MDEKAARLKKETLIHDLKYSIHVTVASLQEALDSFLPQLGYAESRQDPAERLVQAPRHAVLNERYLLLPESGQIPQKIIVAGVDIRHAGDQALPHK